MEKEKKNTGLKVLVIILIIAILGLCGYIAYDKGLFTSKGLFNSLLNKEDVLAPNDNKDKIKETYVANDYVNVIDYAINDHGDVVKKVEFKNINNSLVSNFLSEQDKIIASAVESLNYYYNEGNSSSKEKMVESEVWYQVNDKMLTVHQTITTKYGIENYKINVINIDLENNKVLSNEEIIKMANTNFNVLATDIYNNKSNNCTNENHCFFKKTDDGNCSVSITKSELIAQKDYYINLISNGLNGAIACYIKDGKVKYDYYIGSIDLIYSNLCKGGPFPIVTENVN